MSRVLVIGAGAAGSALAALLHRSGTPAQLLARGARLGRLREEGIAFADSTGLQTVPVRAVGWDDIGEPPDIVLLAVKTCDLDAALAEAARRPELAAAAIITVQNGIDAPEQARKALPDARVIAARMHGFVEFDGAVLRHVGVPISLAFGPWRPDTTRGAEDDRCEANLLELLEAAGIGARISQNIEGDLWAKFMLAASLGGVGAALGLPAGQVLANEAGRCMLRDAMREVKRLAASSGVTLPEACVEQTMAFVASFPIDATTSLQRNLETGTRSEYSALVGAALRMAATLGEPLEAFPAINACIRKRGLLATGPIN